LQRRRSPTALPLPAPGMRQACAAARKYAERGSDGNGPCPYSLRTMVQTLANAIDPRYKTLIYTAAYTGLRSGELLALTRADIERSSVIEMDECPRRSWTSFG
jgi:integrase